MSKHNRSTAPMSAVFLVFLVMAGFLGNYCRLDLFFRVDFLFGSIAVLIALYLYGLSWGVLSAVIASSYTYTLWGHPYAIIIFTLEALFVGAFLRSGRRNLLLLDGMYWLFVGMPAVWFFYHSVMQMDGVSTLLIMFKQNVNGIFNALIASLVVTHFPVSRFASRGRIPGELSLHESLFNLLVALVLFPSLLIIVMGSREELRRTETNVSTQLRSLSEDLASHLRFWFDEHMQSVAQLADVAGKWGMKPSSQLQHDTETIKKTSPDFHNMYVGDATGTTIAFYPEVNEKGESTIGINFADRPYFQQLQKTRRPVVSPVFIGRGGIFSPIVTLTVPVLEGNRFLGYALGALDLGRIAELLRPYQKESTINITLTDPAGHIIASTAADRKPMEIFDPRVSGELTTIDSFVFQWFLNGDKLPSMIQTKRSLYVHEKVVSADIPWKLIVETPVAPHQHYLYTVTAQKLSIMAGLAALSFLLAATFSRWIVQPISRLANVTTNLPDKLLQQQDIDWPGSSALEIHTLISNFQSMMRALERNFQALQDRSAELARTNEELKGEITERKRAEEALREGERRYRELADLLPQPVFEMDAHGNLTFANRAAFDCFGYSQEDFEMGLNTLQMLIEEDRERARRNIWLGLGGEKPGEAEYTVQRKDGSRFPVVIYASPIIRGDKSIGLRGIILDITERKKTEEELLKVQKLESLGVLAGGIAHDFNNILTAIIGNISLAKAWASPDDKIFNRLEQTEKASLRARDLTQQLITFSRGGEPVKKRVSLAPLINDACSFALRGSNVRCEFAIPEDLWTVEVDEGQIIQVINNMVINACQAMPEGGIIRVACRNISDTKALHLPLEAGRYVDISIRDQGAGIAPENLPHIFDPYFSTKQFGSGLGLASAYSIIRRHFGHITVESEEGTTFHIYLPASAKQEVAAVESERGVFVGSGRVLFMDDERIVRAVAGEMLEHLGYEVAFAEDGARAIEIYRSARESGDPFDVIIMDLTIPGGMGGKEAVRRLLALDPNARAIVSSGYSNDPIMSNFRDFGFQGVLVKPYKIDELSKVLEALITAGHA